MCGLFRDDFAESLQPARPHDAKLVSRFHASGEQLKSKAIIIAILALSVFLAGARPIDAQQPAQSVDRRHFNDDDRASMREWYRLHRDELPLGARKKDRLPHDLEALLKVNEPLPEILRPRVQEVSSDFLVRVPPAADGCHYVFIGGNVVILERKTENVYDIYNFRNKK